MPSVFTIQGPELHRAKKCKTVSNGRTGCTIQLCYVGKSKKTPSGWKFMKGTSQCPLGRSKRRKKRKRRKR